ncbi:protein kinase family protein [Thermopolyspora sp. NPDC052614]|uniref:protein kinase family protein n=1 Tax=Thermopolyspora sp. NPDC052614 TaxID=3155682 RepID=UPI0034230D61
MSMSAIEPGTRLSDRFLLEDRVHQAGGATLWKATDEILARPVAVHTFSPEFELVDEVVTAARAASRLTDPRLTQVFDAADDGDTAYVVTEWVTGESLVDLLAGGPLEPERAAGLVAEAAEALAHAHEAGLAHLLLTPERLVWTGGGTVKVLGLAVDAALTATTSDEPAVEDARGLGRLLYAALTATWPGEEECGLPPAPRDDGKLCTPRQVRAGVPGTLDAITCRAVLQEPRRNQPPLASPAEIAEALADVPRPAPAPAPTPPAVGLRSEAPSGLTVAGSPQLTVVGPPPGGTTISRALVIAVVAIVVVAVGLGAWTIGRNLAQPAASGQAAPSPTASGAAPSKGPVEEVKAAKAHGFDPLGDRTEHPEIAADAIDGKDSTEWHTDSYNSAEFGRLKKGVGLLLDMGRSIRVADVVVELGGTKGSSLELKVGDSNDLDDLKTVADHDKASGTVTLTPDKEVSGRYVLIWFTRLPPFEGRFRGTIYDVVVHSPGSA